MDQAVTPREPRVAFDLDRVVGELRAARNRWRDSQNRAREPRGRELPSPEALAEIVADLRAALFPMRLGPPDLRQESEDFFVGHTLDKALHALVGQVTLELRHAARRDSGSESREPPREESGNQTQDRAHGEVHDTALKAACAQARDDDAGIEVRALQITRDFAAALPRIRSVLDTDVLAAYRGDPAARSVDEVLLCYPGVGALIHHRIAHQLYVLGAPLLARIVAELAHGRTGVDIHPGARIGPGCFIDHGTGVVIGETAEIGERVRIYQAVTLGARSFPADTTGHLHKGLPRHPIVEDDVVIYAGATILGRINIGRGSIIGGNVWLTRSVEPGSHVSQATTRSENVEAGAGI